MKKKDWKKPLVIKIKISEITLDGASGNSENPGKDLQPDKRA